MAATISSRHTSAVLVGYNRRKSLGLYENKTASVWLRSVHALVLHRFDVRNTAPSLVTALQARTDLKFLRLDHPLS